MSHGTITPQSIPKTIPVLSVLLVAVLALRAGAQSDAGAWAGVQGTVEVEHAGVWEQASVGTTLAVGDRVRTGAGSQATLVLREDAAIDVAPNSELAVETPAIDESARQRQVIVQLALGKVRVWVSAVQGGARARYEVETPTAVAAVRGSECVVSYDGATETTDIVGLEGQVDVHAKLAVMSAGAGVGPNLMTRVAKGRYPLQPQRVNAARLQQYLEGLDLVGTGRRDGLNVLHPAVVGQLLAPQDVPSAGAAPSRAADEPTALSLHAPAPGSVADRLSPDVYTNTQPLRDYRQTPPGQVPPSATGGVHVGF